MEINKEEALLIFVTLTESIKDEMRGRLDAQPTKIMADLMNKLSDDLTK